MNKIPMTPQGMYILLQELNELKNIERNRVAQEINDARLLGDLRENSEYHAAREKQGLIEARIRDIENKLSNAEVIDITKLLFNGTVVFGSTVELQNIVTNTNNIYKLVGDDEANVKNGKISIYSPIARAIIGKKAGDLVTVSTPSGITNLKIIKIQFI